MNASLSEGALANMASANGARIPSTPDDFFADTRSAAFRAASVRRFR
jgi:hypothetical protein